MSELSQHPKADDSLVGIIARTEVEAPIDDPAGGTAVERDEHTESSVVIDTEIGLGNQVEPPLRHHHVCRRSGGGGAQEEASRSLAMTRLKPLFPSMVRRHSIATWRMTLFSTREHDAPKPPHPRSARTGLPCLTRYRVGSALDGARSNDELRPLVRGERGWHVPNLVDYRLPTTAGKTSPQIDLFHGRFVRLVPDTEVVQTVEFETNDPSMQGEMTITYTLAEPLRPWTGRRSEMLSA